MVGGTRVLPCGVRSFLRSSETPAPGACPCESLGLHFQVRPWEPSPFPSCTRGNPDCSGENLGEVSGEALCPRSPSLRILGGGVPSAG